MARLNDEEKKKLVDTILGEYETEPITLNLRKDDLDLLQKQAEKYDTSVDRYVQSRLDTGAMGTSPYWMEVRGYCGGFLYLDGTYWSLDADEDVKPLIALLKRNMMTLSPHSPDYTMCKNFITALDDMLEKAADEESDCC